MTFTAENVQAALMPRSVRFYARVDSTNDIAHDWLLAGAATGTVVVADEQVKGRGRLGREWYAPPGTALLVSVILHPRLEHVPFITMLGALAIADAIEHIGGLSTSIKWPNDVHLSGRKVSGVLPEAVWDGGTLRGVVVGIGINVSIDFAGTGLADTAISIEPALGRPVDRLALLVTLLNRIDYWSQNINKVLEAWKGRLTTLGKRVSFEQESGIVQGTAVNVDEQGALLVQAVGGEIYRILAGDVALGGEE